MEDTNWVKLCRNLHGKFDKNPKKDILCWNVYVFLLEEANWEDGDILRGQIVTTSSEISTRVPLFTPNEVRRILQKLENLGFITIERAGLWCNAGHKITLRYYPCQNIEIIYNDQKVTSKRRANDEQMTSKRRANDEHNNSIKLDNSELLTSKRRANDEQMTSKRRANDETIQKNKRTKEIKKRDCADEVIADPFDDIDDLPIEKPKPEVKTKPPRKIKEPKETPDSSKVWKAYVEMYEHSYGIAPESGAAKYKICGDLAKRFGEEETVEMLLLFFTEKNAFYKDKCHNLRLFMADIDKFKVKRARKSRLSTQNYTPDNSHAFRQLELEAEMISAKGLKN